MNKQKTRFGLKELVLLGASLFATEKANAGRLTLKIIPESDIGTTYTDLIHYSKSTDEEGRGDSPYVGADAPQIDMWSKTNFNYPCDRLSMDSRSADSTSNYLVEISGRELKTEPENASINFRFTDFGLPGEKENNFSWKNLVVELYDVNSINDSNNLLGVFDAHDLANGDVNFPSLFVNNGLSYQIVVRPRNYADLNLDNKVNFIDKAILARAWQNGDANYTNGWEHYADIDRSGGVDMNDLGIFTDEWLFQGCDPNTFVKSGYINKLAPLFDKGYRLAFLPGNHSRLAEGSAGLETTLGSNSDVYNEQKARLRKDRRLFAKRTDKGKKRARA